MCILYYENDVWYVLNNWFICPLQLNYPDIIIAPKLCLNLTMSASFLAQLFFTDLLICLSASLGLFGASQGSNNLMKKSVLSVFGPSFSYLCFRREQNLDYKRASSIIFVIKNAFNFCVCLWNTQRNNILDAKLMNLRISLNPEMYICGIIHLVSY